MHPPWEFPIMTSPPVSFPALPVHYTVAAGLYAACLTHMLHTHTNVATAGEGGMEGAARARGAAAVSLAVLAESRAAADR